MSTVTISRHGMRGLSAYQVAALHGFGGTEAEWVAAQDAVTWPGIDCATLGDSRAAGNDYVSGTSTIYGAHIIPVYASMKGGGRWHFPRELCFGVAGTKSYDLYDASTGTPGQKLLDCIASSARVVLLFTGTNDWPVGKTAAEVIANVTGVLQRLTQAGKTVIACTDTPRGNSSFAAMLLTSTQLAYALQYRGWLLDAASRMRGIYVADTYAELAVYDQTDGRVAATDTYDGLHAVQVGAEKASRPIFAILDKLFPARGYTPDIGNAGLFDAVNNPRGNLLANGAMVGTGGGVGTGGSGSLAPSWSSFRNAAAAAGSGMGFAYSKVARSNPTGSWQQLALSGTTAANAEPTVQISQAMTAANFNAGDVVEAMMELELDAANTGLEGVKMSFSYTKDGVAQYAVANDMRYDNSPIPNIGFTGTGKLFLITPRLTLGGVITLPQVVVEARFLESSTLAATLRWGNVKVRKI